MTILAQIARALFSLFVDDELLAVGIIAVVAVTTVLSLGFQMTTAAAIVLVLGNLLVLAAGALRTAARKRNSSKADSR